MKGHDATFHPLTDDRPQDSTVKVNTNTTAVVGCATEGAGVSSLSPASSVYLPLPPSANRMWRHYGKRTVIAPEYDSWLRTVAALLKIDRVKQVVGPFTVAITIPLKARCDLDNYCKPILDAMQKLGVVTNDKLAQQITLSRGDAPKGHCIVSISEI